jgi:hypothetical protein
MGESGTIDRKRLLIRLHPFMYGDRGQCVRYAPIVDRAETGIHLRCRVNWLSFGPIFTKPNVSIDGRTEVRSWGQHFFPISPGSHEVSVSFRWPGGSNPEASTTVDVAPGEQVYVEYRTPFMLAMAVVEKPSLRVVHPNLR